MKKISKLFLIYVVIVLTTFLVFAQVHQFTLTLKCGEEWVATFTGPYSWGSINRGLAVAQSEIDLCCVYNYLGEFGLCKW